MPRSYRSLKALKVRPDWNKYTLYALSKLRNSETSRLSYFQQKWKAKSALRAYHGPHVREGYWERLFTRRLNGVVSMDYKYLARNDGSELATGRGAGAITEENGVIQVQQGQSGPLQLQKTPYMNMAFFPLERRLDTAIWRALFASSIQQARQMVNHGAVKVNGKKMKHAGYLLNPGDMFQIEPDRVMYATGAKKQDKNKPDAWDVGSVKPTASEETSQTSGEQRIEASEESDEAAASDTSVAGQEAEASATASVEESSAQAEADPKAARKELKRLRDMAKDLVASGKQDLSGKRLRNLRAFSASVQTAMSKAGRKIEDGTSSSDEITALTQMFEDLAAEVPVDVLPAEQAKTRKKQEEDERMELKSARQNAELLAAALKKARENPVDSSKPYATPWQPRPYMSAFAFIPRYLEVNQNICAAVYLRHPVARPGLAEVPTPFDPDAQQLAFNWYLKRR